jgi:pimeloyl-ACP methyl ester carboxylesterase
MFAMFDSPRRRQPFAVRVSSVLGLAAVMLWSGSVACLWTNESRLVFQARRSRFRALVSTEGVVELRTADGFRLDALRLSHDGASRYWILFCPPSGATVHGRVRRHLQSLHAGGYNVLAFDYRGFGRNPGEPSEAGVYEDALTAYRHLTGTLDVPPQRIILAGRSLGSAVAVELATRVPSGGLLVLSAIDSVPARASRLYPWAPVRLLATQRFDSLGKAAQVTVPVVQVHGLGDWLVPIDDARALFERFPGRKVMLELPGRHNDVGFADDALSRTLGQFWPNPQAGVSTPQTARPDNSTTSVRQARPTQ